MIRWQRIPHAGYCALGRALGTVEDSSIDSLYNNEDDDEEEEYEAPYFNEYLADFLLDEADEEEEAEEEFTETMGGAEIVTWRYYASSLPADILLFMRGACSTWRFEAFSTRFSIVDTEQNEETTDWTMTRNLGTIRKWRTTMLRHVEPVRKGQSTLENRSYYVTKNPMQILYQLACIV